MSRSSAVAVVILSTLAGPIVTQTASAQEQRPVKFAIDRRRNDQWQLLRDGRPFYVKGTVGWHSYELLARAGGNAVRTTARQANLDRAHRSGLMVLANLPVRGQRNGMNWGDAEALAAQRERVRQTVRQLKDHPAVMAWTVGNELDWIPPGIPHHPQLWQRLNDLAVEIHKIDPHHPVMTVVGTGRFERKIQKIVRQCSDMDLLGINAYGDLHEVTALARRFWPKPYLITEWGPTGHWQVPKTAWRAPLEQTSTQKAQVIWQRYTQVVRADTDHCLGSFVFLWGQKQETTHTWYGMFLDDHATESVDVMQYVWSGAWPDNRAPAVLSLDIIGFPNRKEIYLQPARTYEAKLACYDPDHDPLTFQWDIRPEVQIPESSYAGSMEKPAEPIPNLIPSGQDPQIRFTTPANEGPYRLFVQVLDGHNHVGYANAPFYVRPKP